MVLWRCMVGSHGRRTSMGAWVSPYYVKKMKKDEEDGRERESWAEERERESVDSVKTDERKENGDIYSVEEIRAEMGERTKMPLSG